MIQAIIAAIVGVCLLIAGVVLYSPLKYRLEERAAARLREDGLPAVARVLAQRDLSSRYRYMDDDIVLDVEVTAPGRPPWRVSFRPFLRAQRSADFEPGGTIPVRYDPAAPERIAYAPK